MGRDSQNFLQQILKIFISLEWIWEAITHKNGYYIICIVDNICFKKTFSLKILWPKVTKILRIRLKKFCEYGPRYPENKAVSTSSLIVVYLIVFFNICEKL